MERKSVLISGRANILELLKKGYEHVATVDIWCSEFSVEGDCYVLEGTDEGLIDVWCRGAFTIKGRTLSQEKG